jgi:hypothetical protein
VASHRADRPAGFDPWVVQVLTPCRLNKIDAEVHIRSPTASWPGGSLGGRADLWPYLIAILATRDAGDRWNVSHMPVSFLGRHEAHAARTIGSIIPHLRVVLSDNFVVVTRGGFDPETFQSLRSTSSFWRGMHSGDSTSCLMRVTDFGSSPVGAARELPALAQAYLQRQKLLHHQQ